ncbi:MULTISPECIES: CsxC family protein [Bacillus cereus group]|uniref:CsxC family protein n=1 Tax=Bacillus cereus group TaxID=86661 RepID=UPI0018F72FA0|nr:MULTISPECIES: hypothetical protein [Bacillus cereus group]MBJ8102173.1 hypothetical protein [Bacillus cereus group sp. N11]MCU5396803.1 hypothetical protein [Bacillus toyonensis]QWH48674.1 hypothetical protein EXW64_30880 [Bacillus toyonensis]
MSEQDPINTSCQVLGQTQTPLSDKIAAPIINTEAPLVQMPVILAERTIQIVVESNISLDPPAIEIKRILKNNVFLTQCELLPLAFIPIPGTDYKLVKKAKLFLQGYIRKNIEYVNDEYNGIIYNSIVNVPFSGSTDLIEDDFLSLALIASSSNTTFHFINPKNGDLPHLEKCSFGDIVYYNKQPYCELVSTQIVGLDFSPCLTNLNEPFNTFREIIVLNLTLKILQIQQVQI